MKKIILAILTLALLAGCLLPAAIAEHGAWIVDKNAYGAYLMRNWTTGTAHHSDGTTSDVYVEFGVYYNAFVVRLCLEGQDFVKNTGSEQVTVPAHVLLSSCLEWDADTVVYPGEDSLLFDFNSSSYIIMDLRMITGATAVQINNPVSGIQAVTCYVPHDGFREQYDAIKDTWE